VTVEVKDGGYGDADGVANGIIIDPSGLSPAPPVSAAGGGGGGGGGCFMSALHNASGAADHGLFRWVYFNMRWLLATIGK
jgi:hypothetical protein